MPGLIDESRKDYQRILAETGFTLAHRRAISENQADQMPMPGGDYRVTVAPSKIEGNGLFATAEFSRGALICPARIAGKRTPAGRFTNHSIDPNAKATANEAHDIDLVAIRTIRNMEEITLDYRQAKAEGGRNSGRSSQ